MNSSDNNLKPIKVDLRLRIDFSCTISKCWASVNIGAVQGLQDNFIKIVEENYTSDQLYNAAETALYCKKMPECTYISKNENSAFGFKVSKDKITLLLC